MSTHVVIYDIDDREEYYGYFSTPEEAREMFTQTFPGVAGRICVVIEDIEVQS